MLAGRNEAHQNRVRMESSDQTLLLRNWLGHMETNLDRKRWQGERGLLAAMSLMLQRCVTVRDAGASRARVRTLMTP